MQPTVLRQPENWKERWKLWDWRTRRPTFLFIAMAQLLMIGGQSILSTFLLMEHGDATREELLRLVEHTTSHARLVAAALMVLPAIAIVIWLWRSYRQLPPSNLCWTVAALSGLMMLQGFLCGNPTISIEFGVFYTIFVLALLYSMRNTRKLLLEKGLIDPNEEF